MQSLVIRRPTLKGRATAAKDVAKRAKLAIGLINGEIAAADAKARAAGGVSHVGGLAPAAVFAGISAAAAAFKTNIEMGRVTLESGNAVLLRNIAGQL